MTITESAIIVMLFLLIFAILFMFFWESFEMVFKAFRYYWVSSSYFSILVQNGELTDSEEALLTNDISALGMTLTELTVTETTEWGGDVILNIKSTYDYELKDLNGSSESKLMTLPFLRKSRANCLKGGS